MQRQHYRAIFHHCHAACLTAGDDHQQALWHIVQLLVIKAYDERSTKSLVDSAVLVSSADDQKQLCDQLRQLFVQACAHWPALELPPCVLPNDLLITLIQLLAPHHFFDREAPADMFGLLYTCLTPLHTKRAYGQFFTHPLLTEALVQLLPLRPDDCLVDPTCGTGGLLLTAYRAAYRASAGTASLQLWGIERDPTLARLCRIALTIAGVDACVGQGDYLRSAQIASPRNTMDMRSIRPTIMLLNPPYGSRRADRVTDAGMLERFAMGHVWRQQSDNTWAVTDTLQTSKGVAAALLCIEQSIRWLEPGGTLVLILPHGLLDTKEGHPLRTLMLDTCRIGAILSLPGEAFAPEVFLHTALVLLHKRHPDTSPDSDEAIFMGEVQRIGQNRRGESLSISQADGTTRLDEDLSALVAAYCAYRDTHMLLGDHGRLVLRSALHPDTLSLNPRRYTRPVQTHQARLQEHAESGAIQLRRLGDIAQVTQPDRFRRPYADPGVTSGEHIRPYVTGTALTQWTPENVKYLDLTKADQETRRLLVIATLQEGQLLVTDSGTIGRVIVVLAHQAGMIATNNAIRITIDDVVMRGYIYQFLRSSFGQALLASQCYGSVQQHVDRQAIANLRIPFPCDAAQWRTIGQQVVAAWQAQEHAYALAQHAQRDLENMLVRLTPERSSLKS